MAGGGKGTGAGTPVKQESKFELSPEQRQLFEMALPHVEAFNAQAPAIYGGQVRAALSPEELQAQELYKLAVPGLGALTNQAASSQQFTLGTDQLNPSTNPYIDAIGGKITQNITDKLTQQILPNIRGGEVAAAGPYGGGSTRALNAERIATGTALDSMGSALNDLYFRNYQAGIGNILQSQQLNPTVLGSQLFGADVLGSVGAQNRMQEQAALDEAQQKFNLQQYLPFIRASELLGLMGAFPQGTAVTTATGATPPRVSPFMSGIGGALTGAATGSAFGPLGAGLGGAGGLVFGLMNR